VTTASRARSTAAAGLSLAILALAAWELHRQALSMDWPALRAALLRIDLAAACLAVLATAASFLGLATIEAWAVRSHAGLRAPLPRVMLTGAASHAVCHVLGWHAVLGALVRRNGYGASPAQLLAVMLAVGAAVVAGVVGMLGVAAAALVSNTLAAVASGALVVVALAANLQRGRATRESPRRVGLVRRVAAIAPIATLEAAAALTALWVMLPAGSFPSWSVFVVTCLLAQAAGVASHVPGGVGVFEAAMLASVPADVRPGLLAAILAYRALYGLLPLLVLGLPWWLWTSLHRRPLDVPDASGQLERG
jgi:uncharacterized membrane protein YbhN (UPF0104 family)